LTQYKPEELSEHWQFKIVRGSFNKREKIEAEIEAQARFGWILVEVFDQGRVRFKRPASAVLQDDPHGDNPYAVTAGSPEAAGCGTKAAASVVAFVALALWASNTG